MSYIKRPTTIVIFGATGDLNRKKLMPALFDLYTKSLLPKQFRIVGFSRQKLTHDAYRSFVRNVIEQKGHKHSSRDVDIFLDHLFYCPGLFEDAASYGNLSKFLYEQDEKLGQCSCKLFYLAVPPNFYDTIFQNVADSGLSIPCAGDNGWTRILVEKPFGKDLLTAQELDKKLGLLFDEDQIFRIDHYLAKETLENILAFRFSNSIFQPAWNNKYIGKVHIQLFEDSGVGKRGAFYDGVGALRDVGQNHILQMLALIAMEDPGVFEAKKIRLERENVIQSLRAFSREECEEYTVKGQYTEYRREEGVLPQSNVETYFYITAFIDNERWRGVPFHLEGGKRMYKKKTEITVYFKKLDSCVYKLDDNSSEYGNVLKFVIQPEEKISVRFWVKKPGFGMKLEPQLLTFSYEDTSGSKHFPDAYEKLFLSTLEGDQTLFTSSREVEAAWEFITPIMEYWRDKEPVLYGRGCKEGGIPLMGNT
ncbi:glucose-6-phosphate dehydrogenase [Patescibacteria group bacterium]|nr:glucose-6-phosphate dehydrogenase [Patescibacteria group bacterium]